LFPKSESLEKGKALRQSMLKKALEGILLSVPEIAQGKVAADYKSVVNCSKIQAQTWANQQEEENPASKRKAKNKGMSGIVIYQSGDNQIEVSVQFDKETVWLNLNQMAQLFDRDKSVISRHLHNIFKEGELDKDSVIAKNATTAADGKTYLVEFYNLDAILSVGYRVNSKQGTQFRKWANQILKDYLVQGYALNQKRLQQKQQEVETLKTGLRIVSRAIEHAVNEQEQEVFRQFAKGLALLDDYDHEALDSKGKTRKETIYPTFDAYTQLIKQMYSDFGSTKIWNNRYWKTVI